MFTLQQIQSHPFIYYPLPLPLPLNENQRVACHFRAKRRPRKANIAFVVCAVINGDKEENLPQPQQFEVDKAKAREALQQLDQQLLTLSSKQVPPPKTKTKASDAKLTDQDDQGGIEMSIYEESSLAYLAGGLVILTLFYNILFYTVIKPSIDAPDYYVPDSIQESSALSSQK